MEIKECTGMHWKEVRIEWDILLYKNWKLNSEMGMIHLKNPSTITKNVSKLISLMNAKFFQIYLKIEL